MDQGDAVPISELWEERRFLLDVAHWILGDRSAAESIVDEAYRRWYGLSDAARRQITVPRSWLAKTVGTICLGLLAMPAWGAAGQEEEHPAPPTEPAVVEVAAGRIVLNALESLPTVERAAFVFRAFGLAPGTVADIVGRTEPELAELAERARQWLRLQRAYSTTPQQHDAVAHAVRRACVTEDGELLASLLCPDVTAFFDGGGKVRALTGPVHGTEPVAGSLLTLLARRPRTSLTTHSVNGRTGLVARYGHQVAAVISLDVAGDRVAQAWVMLNPDKLRSWNQPHARDDSGSDTSP
ncbi:RNA polymerase subunit sigma [Streptomyces sp. NBC_00474]|uniref:RNA polymerase subunit sigma n=1 Tax=Streptomyces sp. NBC_00474 TaxID=2975754 RepID=UPI0022550737|nr:RNA polymerase subunit sigma [Streptomyces sp. NBC_00474]MCX5052484.1 RNA polymerase subunit sigma [Streptomyces sp. NBC_00474]